ATLPGGLPTADQIQTFYESYPDLPVRLVQAKPQPSWLGAQAKGYAISDVAPDRIFTITKPAVIRTSQGTFTVKPLEAATQLGAAVEAARSLRAPVGRDALPLARVLRAVEGIVRPLEERDRVVLRLQLRDAGGDVQPARLADRARGDRCLQPAEEMLRLVDPRLREDHCELVAADPAGDVRGADHLAHAVGCLRQHRVAAEVPDLVVHVL